MVFFPGRETQCAADSGMVSDAAISTATRIQGSDTMKSITLAEASRILAAIQGMPAESPRHALIGNVLKRIVAEASVRSGINAAEDRMTWHRREAGALSLSAAARTNVAATGISGFVEIETGTPDAEAARAMRIQAADELFEADRLDTEIGRLRNSVHVDVPVAELGWLAASGLG